MGHTEELCLPEAVQVQGRGQHSQILKRHSSRRAGGSRLVACSGPRPAQTGPRSVLPRTPIYTIQAL